MLHAACRQLGRAGFWPILVLLSLTIIQDASAQTARAYDIVYVRAPRYGDITNTKWPEVINPVQMEPGADLMLLHPNGTEEVLFAAGNGAVVDPVPSFDAKWVYFSYFPDVRVAQLNYQRNYAPMLGADIYKINVATRQVIRLTQQKWEPPAGAANWSTNHLSASSPGKELSRLRHFQSGRVPAAERQSDVCFQPRWLFAEQGHDVSESSLVHHGRQRRKRGADRPHEYRKRDASDRVARWPSDVLELRNPRPARRSCLVAVGNLARRTKVGAADERVQDRRGISFSNATKRQPHRRSGILQSEQQWLRHLARLQCKQSRWHRRRSAARWMPIRRIRWCGAECGFSIALIRRTCNRATPQYRFSPPGLTALSAFTHGEDQASGYELDGSWAGKVTHPSAAPNNDALVVWSPGPVNNLDRPTQLPRADGGIYLLKSGAAINDHRQLVVVKNDPRFNEMQPKALVPYAAIHGVVAPATLPYLPNDGTAHAVLPAGTPFGLVGASSFYKRDTAPKIADTPSMFNGLEEFNTSQNDTNPNWFTQGADAGRYTDADIFAVRIVGMEGVAHRSYGPIASGGSPGFFSHAGAERLRILGEIPLRKSGMRPIRMAIPIRVFWRRFRRIPRSRFKRSTKTAWC